MKFGFTLCSTFLFFCFCLASSCVGNKKFKAENTARITCEARELVLIRELGDRKRESADLIQKVGDLSKNNGQLEKQVTDLLAASELRNQQFGASEQQLRSNLASVQMQLKETQQELSRTNDTLSDKIAAENRVRRSLISLNNDVVESMIPWLPQGVVCEVTNDAAKLTIPNRLLFDEKGTAINSTGRTLSQALSIYLNQHPEIMVEIHAHTDYDLPRTIEDSWEWAAWRARLICKLLVVDFNVNANQLTPVAKGEYFPTASNQTSEGREGNKRTELFFRFR